MSTALFTVVKIEICEAVGKCKISGYLGDHRSTSRETHPTHRNNKKRSHVDQVPQNVDGQEVLNIVLADQPALLADNQPVDYNRGNQPTVDAVVSACLVFIRFILIFYRLQAIHQRL